MKIAIIHSRLDIIGGTQRKVLSLALALQDIGHDVSVYTLAYDKEKSYSALLENLNVVALPGYVKEKQTSAIPALRFLNYLLYSKRESDAARRLARLIDRDTEILNPYDKIGFRVAYYYKKDIKNIPSVVIMDDILTKLWKAWRKSEFDPSFRLPLRQKIFYWLCDWYEVRKFILPHEHMVVIDERTRQWARKYFGKDAVIVRNGLSLEHFRFRARTHPAGRKITLFSAGIYFLHRRYEDIIEALGILLDRAADVELILAGDYGLAEYKAYQARLETLARERGLRDRVVFLGQISEKDLREKYAACDIYISSNHLQSWGLAVFEAMSSGMPVVVSKSAGASEVLTHRENAMLVSPKSPREIADAVEELARDKKLYESLSAQGRTFVEKNITWKKTAQRLCEIFQEAI